MESSDRDGVAAAPVTAAAASSIDAASAPPDWKAHADEVCCPMCEYNLRGLTEPRCPECGFRFAWKDLLDAKVRPHRYLFEHHPEANLRSFCKTAAGAAIRPGNFWASLHPAQLSRPRRLGCYWVACALVILAPLMTLWLDR